MTYSYRFDSMPLGYSGKYIHMMSVYLDDTHNDYVRLNHNTYTNDLVWLYFKPKVSHHSIKLEDWSTSTDEEVFQGSLVHELDCTVLRDIQKLILEKMYRPTGPYNHLQRTGTLDDL